MFNSNYAHYVRPHVKHGSRQSFIRMHDVNADLAHMANPKPINESHLITWTSWQSILTECGGGYPNNIHRKKYIYEYRVSLSLSPK